MVERLLVVWWVFESILHGEPIDPFLVPASAHRRMLSCLWDGAYKIVAHIAI